MAQKHILVPTATSNLCICSSVSCMSILIIYSLSIPRRHTFGDALGIMPCRNPLDICSTHALSRMRSDNQVPALKLFLKPHKAGSRDTTTMSAECELRTSLIGARTIAQMRTTVPRIPYENLTNRRQGINATIVWETRIALARKSPSYCTRDYGLRIALNEHM